VSAVVSGGVSPKARISQADCHMLLDCVYIGA
jgi:hypothetical protein